MQEPVFIYNVYHHVDTESFRTLIDIVLRNNKVTVVRYAPDCGELVLKVQ